MLYIKKGEFLKFILKIDKQIQNKIKLSEKKAKKYLRKKKEKCFKEKKIKNMSEK